MYRNRSPVFEDQIWSDLMYTGTMTIRNVSQAKAQLSALLAQVEKGEEVVITRAGKPVARLILVQGSVKERAPGGLKGKLWISPEFDASDSEIEQLFHA